jgi:hypothetical protein
MLGRNGLTIPSGHPEVWGVGVGDRTVVSPLKHDEAVNYHGVKLVLPRIRPFSRPVKGDGETFVMVETRRPFRSCCVADESHSTLGGLQGRSRSRFDAYTLIPRKDVSVVLFNMSTCNVPVKTTRVVWLKWWLSMRDDAVAMRGLLC